MNLSIWELERHCDVDIQGAYLVEWMFFKEGGLAGSLKNARVVRRANVSIFEVRGKPGDKAQSRSDVAMVANGRHGAWLAHALRGEVSENGRYVPYGQRRERYGSSEQSRERAI